MNPCGYGKTLLAVFGGMLLAIHGCAAGAHNLPVRIQAQETIAPVWISDADRVQGICPDLLLAIERVEPRLQFHVDLQSRSVPSIESELASGEVTAACGMMDSPRRRAAALMVGPPLYTIRHRLAARAGERAAVDTPADLVRMNALVNATRGSGCVLRLREAGVAVDDSTGDNLINLRKLLAGHGRFTCMNELTLARYIRQEGLENRIRTLALVEEAPAWFWVSRKADPRVAPLLGKALTRLRANGELDRIYGRWTRLP